MFEGSFRLGGIKYRYLPINQKVVNGIVSTGIDLTDNSPLTATKFLAVYIAFCTGLELERVISLIETETHDNANNMSVILSKVTNLINKSPIVKKYNKATK